MSFEATDYVWEHSKQQGGALVVMLTLAKHANKDYEAWPGCQRIARLGRMSRRNVLKILGKLMKAGEIKRVGKTKNGVIVYHVICESRFTSQVVPRVNSGSHTSSHSGERQITQTREPRFTRSANSGSHESIRNIYTERTKRDGAWQSSPHQSSTRWCECQSAMEEMFGKERFEAWLGKVFIESDDGRVIRIAVPTRLYQDYIVENFLPEMERILDREIQLLVRPLVTSDPSK